MKRVSRRRLAAFAAQALIDGAPLQDTARQVAAELITTNRQNETDMLVRDIAYELEQRGAVAMVNATSRNKLQKDVLDAIEAFVLASSPAATVSMTTRTDAAIIGGVYITSPSKTWDFTLNKTLADMRKDV